jgi:hypothetical protein
MRAGALAVLGLVLPVLLPGCTQVGELAAQQATSSIDPAYGCLVCHADKRQAFLLGVHSDRSVECHDCHGGYPEAMEATEAHSGDFRGPPNRISTLEICSSCHADPDEMRQYGLPADQVAELRASKHGELLLEREDLNAPTCSDCHDPHTTLRADDARSSVYPPNIPSTCARCHEDRDLMEAYELPTGQVQQYREGAHGVALFERQNFAAPSCIGCHGSHAALPPDVGEITNVCGRCHVRVRQVFDRGPHGQAVRDGNLAGCTACHGSHGTERVPAARIAGTCTGCHEPGSAPALLGLDLQRLLLRVEEEIAGGEEAIRELVRAGHEVGDIRFRYVTAWTAFRQLEQDQHAVDMDALEDLGRRVGSISRDIRSAAEVAMEERWEHKLILIPVWFLALSAVVLAAFRLRRADSVPESYGLAEGDE